MTMTSNSASIAGSGVMNSWPLLNLCATESVKMPNHLPPMYVIARSYKQCDPAGLWAVADPGEGPQGSGPSPYFQTKMFFGDSPPPTPIPPPPGFGAGEWLSTSTLAWKQSDQWRSRSEEDEDQSEQGVRRMRPQPPTGSWGPFFCWSKVKPKWIYSTVLF